MTRGDPARAVAYLRVSTDEQHLGPLAQRRAIEAWAAARGVEVVAWHTDEGVSGAAPLDERPALRGALEDLRRLGAGLLVAAKRDRLARDLDLARALEARLRRVGVQLATTDVGADAPRLVPGLLDLLAEHERELISERTRAALQAKRARGERVSGPPPYGYRFEGVRVVEGREVGGTLAPVEAEQRAIRLMRAWRAEGRSLRQIAADLQRAQVPSRGDRWHATTVARVLRRKDLDTDRTVCVEEQATKPRSLT